MSQNPKSNWKNLFTRQRGDHLLSYYELVVKKNGERNKVAPPQDIVMIMVSKQEDWLVGYFVEKKFPFSFVKIFFYANVKSLEKVEVLSTGQGCVMMKFENDYIRDKVFEEGM